MWTTQNHNRSPIALDVQDDRVVAVQLMRRKNRWTPAVVVNVSRQREATEGHAVCPMIVLSEQDMLALERGLARQGAVGRDIVLMAPPGATHVDLLELPRRGPNTPIDQLARAEMARLARWDESSPFQVSTWDVPPPLRRAGGESAGTSLYAAALPEGAVRGLIDQLWMSGWSVQRVVPAPIAMAALAAGAPDTLSIVIDVRLDRAALTLVRGAEAIYHRDLPDNGLSLLFRGIVAELHMSDADAEAALDLGTLDLNNAQSRACGLCEAFAEALSSELEASLAFAGRRYGELAIQRLSLIGGGARIVGLADWLRTRLEITDTAAPTNGGSSDPVIAGCIALARTPALDRHDVGLLPATPRDLLRRERISRVWLKSAIAVALLAIAGAGGLYATTLGQGGVDQARLAGFGREQTRADADLAEAKAKLSELRSITNFQDRLANQPDYSSLLRVVGGTLDDATVLREMSMAAPAAAQSTPGSAAKAATVRRLRLIGTASAASVLTNQVSALRAIDVFANVELARTSRSADGEGVSFELSLDVVAPPATAAVAPTTSAKGAR